MIKKGIKVKVLSGKDRNKEGEVMEIDRKNTRAKVKGINIVKKHTKPTQNEPGGIKEKESTINLSNIAYYEETKSKPTKIGFKFLEDGRKVRYSKLTGEVIDK